MSFTLTPRKADVALGGVRKGKSGDSLHVRQLLMVIFGASTLSRCSYKGVAAVGGKNKYKMSQQKAARPALPKKGMEVLRGPYIILTFTLSSSAFPSFFFFLFFRSKLLSKTFRNTSWIFVVVTS